MKPSLAPIIIILAAALPMLWTTSCTPSAENSRLTHIESIIDDRPDSALTLLATIDTAALHSDADRALFLFLENLGKYKTYDDSLDELDVSEAAVFFEMKKDYSHASHALFLLGKIYELSGRNNIAATHYVHGADIARQSNAFFQQGLCEMALSGIYGTILDAPRQIIFAQCAADAFKKAGKADWYLYAMLDLSGAYINNCQPKRALNIAKQLIDRGKESKDSRLTACAYEVAGLAAFSLNNYTEALNYYFNSHLTNPDYITENDRINITTAVYSCDSSEVCDEIRQFALSFKNPTPFFIDASNDNYKTAYETLNNYRLQQDSVITKLLTQNINISVDNYHQLLDQQRKQKQQIERFIWIISVLLLCLLSLSIGLWLRTRIKKHKMERDLFMSQVSDLATSLGYATKKENILATHVRELMSQKYETLDSLCTLYYESNNNKRIALEAEKKIKNLISDRKTLEALENTLNIYSDNIYSDLKKDYPNLKEEDYRLFLYISLGFSSSSISLFMKESKEVVYRRKWRLKEKIRKSDNVNKIRYLQNL